MFYKIVFLTLWESDQGKLLPNVFFFQFPKYKKELYMLHDKNRIPLYAL